MIETAEKSDIFNQKLVVILLERLGGIVTLDLDLIEQLWDPLKETPPSIDTIYGPTAITVTAKRHRIKVCGECGQAKPPKAGS